MKALFILFISVFISTIGAAQQKESTELKVISLNSRFKTYFTNGSVDNFGNTINIAFLRGYTLYEMPTVHFEPQTSYINFNDTKDGDTINLDDDAPSIIKEITYKYFVIKNSQEKGLSFNDVSSAGKSFSLDSLLKSNGMDSLNKRIISVDFGSPNELIKAKNGKIILEKFYNLKKESDSPDTVFRYYNDQLKDISFSLSPSLDKEKQSKLYKSLLVMKYPHSLDQKVDFQPYKFEILDEMSLVTANCSKRQIEIYQILFDKYIAQTGK